MPTAAKLISGLLVAGLGWFVANLIVQYLPPETRIGLFREISAALGLWVGWRFLGKRAGSGLGASLSYGLAASGLLVFWMLLTFSGVEMIKRALRKAYGGNPVRALQDMIEVAIGYLNYLTNADVAGTLVIGGFVIGAVAEGISRRWS